MNFKNIYIKQKVLDETIGKAHNSNKEDIQNKRIMALIVETAELANEISAFKYWKKNITIDHAKILEEFADGIHFLCSFALKFDLEENIEAEVVNGDLNDQFIKVFALINIFHNDFTIENLRKVFSCYLGIAKIMDYSDEQIEEYYILKNKINHQRVKDNY